MIGKTNILPHAARRVAARRVAAYRVSELDGAFFRPEPDTHCPNPARIR